MARLDTISDRISRALAAAEESDRARAEPRPRADRSWLVRDAAARYGLTDELAEKITATSPTEVQREARALALERVRLAAAEAEARRSADD